MMEVNNLTGVKIDVKFLKKTAQRVLAGEGQNKIELSIALVNPAEIKKLNKKYRKKDRPTDVLSYTLSKGSSEIIICPQVIKKNAKEFGATFKKELARVLIHGVLHILGYDHEKNKKASEKMRTKEQYYLSLI